MRHPAHSSPVRRTLRTVLPGFLAASVLYGSVPTHAAAACKKDEATMPVHTEQEIGLFRHSIVAQARSQLGLVSADAEMAGPFGFGFKKGADRLLEYYAVAYGPRNWASMVAGLLAPGQKPQDWCGIFALWAIKTGAAVAPSNYSTPLQEAFKHTPYAYLVPLILQVAIPSGDGSRTAKLEKLVWASGGHFGWLPNESRANIRYKYELSTIAAKGQQPVRPGDIAYIIHSSTGDVVHHHAVVEAVAGDVLFLINGNSTNQQITRSRVCLSELDGAYDVENL